MSYTTTPSDTLVLRILENDGSKQVVDTELYVLYDTRHDVFLIRGKRSDTSRVIQNAYSFECESRDSVLELITFLIPKTNKCTVELYTYYDLPINKNDITFDTLRDEVDPSNEMVAYEDNKLSSKFIIHCLSILKYTNNVY